MRFDCHPYTTNALDLTSEERAAHRGELRREMQSFIASLDRPIACSLPAVIDARLKELDEADRAEATL